jgi:hypothetical protein
MTLGTYTLALSRMTSPSLCIMLNAKGLLCGKRAGGPTALG